MIYLVIVLLAAFAVSLMFNFYLHNEILDERRRTYEAEEWIDPIAVQELKEDEIFKDLREGNRSPYRRTDNG